MAISRTMLLALACGCAAAAEAQAPAQLTIDTTAQPTYCGSDGFKSLDFLLGDWIIYERDQPLGLLRVEKLLRGCAMMASTTFIADKYRRAGQEFRFQAQDMYAYADDVWHMLGTDVMGGAFPMKGRVASPGVAVFESVKPRKGVYIRGKFAAQPNGEVLVTAQSSPDGQTGWKPMLEYVYRRNK